MRYPKTRRSRGVTAPDCRHPDGCPRPQSDSAGWCHMHSNRIRKHGDPGPAGALRVHTDAPCLVTSCQLVSARNQLCNRHHLRARRHDGDPEGGQRMRQVDPPDGCSWPSGCPNTHHARGLCQTHSKALYPFSRAGLSGDAIAARWDLWADSCYICSDPAEATDHVKPRAAGGLNLASNLRPICHRCNSVKRDKWLGVARLGELIDQVRTRSMRLVAA